MIKPTIGRMVWYYEHGTTQFNAGVQPNAALIAYVHADDVINIGYFDVNGFARQNTLVKLIQEGDLMPEGCFCTWMPYQIGQAAKTEQADE